MSQEKTLPQFAGLGSIADANLICGYQTDLGHFSASQVWDYSNQGKIEVISTNITLSASDNGKTLLIAAFVQITVPSSLYAGFNVKFIIDAGCNLTLISNPADVTLLGSDFFSDNNLGYLVCTTVGTPIVVSSFSYAFNEGLLRKIAALPTVTGSYILTQEDNSIAQRTLLSNSLALTVTKPSTGNYSLTYNGSYLVNVDVTVTSAALAAGGSSVVIPALAGQIYRIRGIQMSLAAGLSGGGGNRTVILTDGTSTYTTMSSVTTTANAVWGSTTVPVPVGLPMNTPTVAGAAIVFKYSGGTTDYIAGSISMTVLLERTA